MEEYYSNRAQEVVRSAQEFAREFECAEIGTEHILLGLARDRGGLAARALDKVTLSFDKLYSSARTMSSRASGGAPGMLIEFSPRAKAAIRFAVDEAQALKSEEVGAEHLLLGILSETQGKASRILISLGADPNVIRSRLFELMGKQDTGKFGADGGSETPALDAYGRNLTKMAEEGKLDPVIGRDDEIERLIQILSRRTKNNPVLIGDPGVGKTAIVEGLAQMIADHIVPETLLGKQMVVLDMGGLVAGTKYRGEFEDRLKSIIDEIISTDIYILFIDEMHTLVGAGAAEGAMDAANILKPALARGELQAIGATTLDEYRKHIEKDAALERRFQPVLVDEPTVGETVAILQGLKERYEAHHRVTISNEAIEAAAKLSARYIPDRFLPDKAIDLIDEASARVRLENLIVPPQLQEAEAELAKLERKKEEAIASNDFEKANLVHVEYLEKKAKLDKVKGEWEASKSESAQNTVVGAEEVAYIVSKWTGIPVTDLTEAEQEKLLRMEAELHRRIVGQDIAVSAVSQAVRSARAGLKDPNQPIGSFIFLGPTGVGKTELAKTLAEFLYGDEEATVRIDMSEYQERHTVSRLVGAPPGYVGYDEGGQLTEAIRRRPYSVVLLDEIEKANPEIFNILLQVLDDGRLTDGHGKVVDFKNAIIIMTSNIGAERIMQISEETQDSDPEEAYAEMKQAAMAEVKKAFRPEFLNRVDEIIVFHALLPDHLVDIVDLLAAKLRARLADQGVNLELSSAARFYIAEMGYDPAYGARPLRRAIGKLLANPIANALLSGNFAAGDTIAVDVVDDRLVMEKADISPEDIIEEIPDEDVEVVD